MFIQPDGRVVGDANYQQNVSPPVGVTKIGAKPVRSVVYDDVDDVMFDNESISKRHVNKALSTPADIVQQVSCGIPDIS